MINKINWGTKIALLYVGFVAMIAVMVFKSSQHKVDLVSADYYAQELKFQDKIDGKNNLSSLSTKIDWLAKDKQIDIKFPMELVEGKAVGEIKLYRPSNSQDDLKFPLQINEKGNQLIKSEQFKRGVYLMQISFKIGETDYFSEQELFMN
jgi:hypothetical protein